MGISIGQLLVILVIVALLFGTKKLRNIGGDLGNAIKSFRSAMKDDDDTPPSSRPGSIIEGESSASSESDHRDT